MWNEKGESLGTSMPTSFYIASASKRTLITSCVLILIAIWAILRAAVGSSGGVSSSTPFRDSSLALPYGAATNSQSYEYSSYYHDFADVYAPKQEYTATLVLGRLKSERAKTQWAYGVESIERTAVYIVDDPSAEFHLDRNHGRESMVYLQYILDHYDNLTDITFFFHAQEKTWHNNLLLSESSVQTINRMNREWVMKQGYVNVRCEHWPGCPSWVVYNPTRAEFELDPHHGSDMFTPALKDMLWPDEPIEKFPRYFAQTCCSQFAVSADAIRAHPKSAYKALYKWIDGEWLDQWSGRAMEMIWQYVFLNRGVVCPSMHECYCEMYGILCNATRGDIELIDTWNMFRTRGEELQWQVEHRGKQIRKEKGTAHVPWDEHKDAEFKKISKERERIRQLSESYKKLVISHFGTQNSAVDW